MFWYSLVRGALKIHGLSIRDSVNWVTIRSGKESLQSSLNEWQWQLIVSRIAKNRLKWYWNLNTYSFITRGQFWPLGIVFACVCLCVRPCVNHLLVRTITQDPFKLGLPNLDQRCKRPWLRSLSFCGAIDHELQGQILLKSQNLPDFDIVRTITHYPFKLGSQNLDQMCKIAWLRSLLFCVAIDIDIQGKIWLKKSNFLVSPLLEIHNHHITTRVPWVPRLLHRRDCFMVSILCACLYT